MWLVQANTRFATRERERELELENLFYKDCSLGSVKNLSNNKKQKTRERQTQIDSGG